jgi:hypothetical protein
MMFKKNKLMMKLMRILMITKNLIKVKDNSEKTKVKKAKATIQILFDFKIK